MLTAGSLVTEEFPSSSKYQPRMPATRNIRPKESRKRYILPMFAVFCITATFILLLAALFGGSWWTNDKEDTLGLFRSCTTYLLQSKNELICYFRDDILQFPENKWKDFDIVMMILIFAGISCMVELILILGIFWDYCAAVGIFPILVVIFTFITSMLSMVGFLFVELQIHKNAAILFINNVTTKGWTYHCMYAEFAVSLLSLVAVVVMVVLEMRRNKHSRFYDNRRATGSYADVKGLYTGSGKRTGAPIIGEKDRKVAPYDSELGTAFSYHVTRAAQCPAVVTSQQVVGGEDMRIRDQFGARMYGEDIITPRVRANYPRQTEVLPQGTQRVYDVQVSYERRPPQPNF